MKNITYLFFSLLLIQCNPAPLKWQLETEIDLGTITPIGIAQMGDHIWVSDGDNNRLAHLNSDGSNIEFHEGFERPMHIDADENQLYIPEYGKDQITIYRPDSSEIMHLTEKLDAPAGVSVFNGQVAIADFYNHRILFKENDQWISFGKEGKKQGEFYYPTDVQITESSIYVADAYNNRVQVFDHQGNYTQTIGVAEKINAATGVYVSEEAVFITDFENDRVLVYDHLGALTQQIDSLSKPTDLLVVNNKLYVTNYKGKNISIFITK